MGNDIVIKERKQINFRHNKQIYKVDVGMSLSFLVHYRKNKDTIAYNQLIKECILKKNPQLIDIIDKLHNKQIIYILNAIIKNNEIDFIFIDRLEEFDNFMELHHQYMKERMSEVSKGFNQTYGENISVVIEQISTIASNVGKVTKQIIETTNNIYTTFQKQYVDIIKESLNIFLEIMQSIDMDKIDECLKGYLLIFNKLGYPLLDISIDNIIYIIDNKDSDNLRNIIDKIIQEEYTIERVDTMLNSWKEYVFLKNRIHILTEGIETFKAERYYTAIPVFFSQLEGIIAELFGHNGSMNGEQYKIYVSKVLSCDGDNELNEKEVTRAFIFSNMLKGFIHGGEIPKFSRHAILHGGDTRYGTRVNNINIIILFDSMMCEINKMLKCE